MPDNILFTGEWDASEIAKGVDGMIASFKRAQEQGDVSAETLKKMQGAVDGVTDSVKDLKDATGKDIAPSLNDGRIAQQAANIKKSITDMSDTVSKRVQEARDTLAGLIATQEKYKNDINGLNATIKENNVEYRELNKQLSSVTNGLRNTQQKAAELRKELANLSPSNTRRAFQINKELDQLTAAEIRARDEAGRLRTALDGTRNSTLELQGEVIKTKTALTGANAAVSAQSKVVKEADKASNAFSKGLSNAYSGLRKIAYVIPGLGIAGLISMIAGPLVEAFEKWINKMSEAEISAKAMNDAIKVGSEGFGKAAVQVAEMREKIELAKEGFLDKKTVLEEYNKTIGETVGFANSLNAAEDFLIKKGDAYIELMFKKATAAGYYAEAQKEAAKNARNEVDTEENFGVFDFINANRKNLTFTDKLKQIFTPLDPDILAKEGQAAQKELTEQITDNQKKIFDKYKLLIKGGDAMTAEAAKYAKDHGLKFDPIKFKIDTKQIENIYQQELQKLKADIAKVTEKGFTDESTITAAINEDFKKRDLAFQKAFKNKQLTAGQLASLQENLKNLQDLTLKKSLADFATQKAEYLKQINDQLTSLQLEEGTKRISTIQDQFERERQTIEAETSSTAAALQAKRDELIADITKNAAKNGVTPEQLQPQIKAIEDTYSRLLDDLEIIKNQKLQKLSFDTFEALDKNAKNLFNSKELGISQTSLIDIQKQAQLFTSGKISYESFQKSLTKIARDESQKRFDNEVQKLQALITRRENYLIAGQVSGTLTTDQQDQLQKEIVDLKKQLADAVKGNAVQGAADTKTDNDKKLQELLNYANAIKSVTDSVISFWQQTNEAEQKALDRSIALQDRRVDAARLVAEKGNSEYLRMEEEKQQQLLIKQENAARRQMAINAALQASQLLVAITGAIAKIAEPGVGTVDVITSIGVIIGALASGYALVRSLQQNQPSFFVGTEDTGTGGDVDDKGGFHAVLHPHERVMTAEENKKLKGLSNKEVIDRVTRVENLKFFTQQLKVKPAPTLNMEAMDMAINSGLRREALHFDGIERELKLNNHLQMKTHRLLKDMGMSWSLDMHGFSVSYMKTVDEINKSKKK